MEGQSPLNVSKKDPLTSTVVRPSTSKTPMEMEPDMTTIFNDPSNQVAEWYHDYKKAKIKEIESSIKNMDPKKEEKKILKLQEERKKIMEFAQWRANAMTGAYDAINRPKYREPAKEKSDEESEDTTDDDERFRTIESSLRENQNLTLSILDQLSNIDINREANTPSRQIIGTIRPPNLTNVANSSKNPFNPNLKINPTHPSNQQNAKNTNKSTITPRVATDMTMNNPNYQSKAVVSEQDVIRMIRDNDLYKAMKDT